MLPLRFVNFRSGEMTMPANEVWAVLEGAREEPWRRLNFDWTDTILTTTRPTPRAVAMMVAINHVAALREALAAVLAEPYGCTLCDSGKPRTDKGHQPDCSYDQARAALRAMDEALGEKA